MRGLTVAEWPQTGLDRINDGNRYGERVAVGVTGFESPRDVLRVRGVCGHELLQRWRAGRSKREVGVPCCPHARPPDEAGGGLQAAAPAPRGAHVAATQMCGVFLGLPPLTSGAWAARISAVVMTVIGRTPWGAVCAMLSNEARLKG